jgi:rhamnose transport system substrate-binding protein
MVASHGYRRAWFAPCAAVLLLLGACGHGEQAKTGAGKSATARLRIGLVAKSLGNGFFDAVKKGGDEAATELGTVDIIFTGPTTPTAEGQIEVLNALIAQRVDAIALSANDPDALVPTLQKAMQRGIKVISYDSAVAAGGRNVHLAPSSDPLIGATCLQLAAAAAPGGQGEYAILSATPTSTNQNAWIAAMQSAAPQFPGLKLVATVYGDDVADKSYRETTALLQRFPHLAVIIAPTSVGIVAAAKAVEDAKRVGQVYVTGLGLPSELAGHVSAGSVKSFAIWNPIDLGYTAVQIAAQLARGNAGGPGSSFTVGRMGTVRFGADGTGPMSKPFTYDGSNVAEFAKIF